MATILNEGTYYIADNCKAVYKNRTLVVTEKTEEQLKRQSMKRCRDCLHQKIGKCCLRNQWWETTYCDLRPKTIAGKSGYYYNAPDSRVACEDFLDRNTI